MKRTDLTAVVCVFLPLVMGAPVDDALKQQIASGLLRGEDTPYWAANTLNQGRTYGGIPLRRLEATAGYHMGNLQKRFDSLSGATFGTQKRNFDEIDRIGFGSFLNKRNFDEIDRSGLNGFNKRNFDEIDRTGFGSFVKRAV